MVHQHLVAILSFIFVNVVVLNCFVIEPNIDFGIEPNEDFMENKSFENGPWYNPNKTDKGPISSEIFDIHPNLVFLGTYNGKFWYIERIPANYKEAQANCSSMGMYPAKANQAELNFLSNVTSSSDDYAWLGGYIPMALESFVWAHDFTHPSATRFVTVNTLALTMSRYTYPTDSALHPQTESTNRFYYCMIP